MQECQSSVRLHDENRTSWSFDYGTIPHSEGLHIDEPYLAKLGQHSLMPDEQCQACSAYRMCIIFVYPRVERSLDLGYTAIALKPTLVLTPEASYYFHPESCQLHNHLSSSSQLA
jgi:hypothetical protein